MSEDMNKNGSFQSQNTSQAFPDEASKSPEMEETTSSELVYTGICKNISDTARVILKKLSPGKLSGLLSKASGKAVPTRLSLCNSSQEQVEKDLKFVDNDVSTSALENDQRNESNGVDPFDVPSSKEQEGEDLLENAGGLENDHRNESNGAGPFDVPSSKEQDGQDLPENAGKDESTHIALKNDQRNESNGVDLFDVPLSKEQEGEDLPENAGGLENDHRNESNGAGPFDVPSSKEQDGQDLPENAGNYESTSARENDQRNESNAVDGERFVLSSLSLHGVAISEESDLEEWVSELYTSPELYTSDSETDIEWKPPKKRQESKKYGRNGVTEANKYGKVFIGKSKQKRNRTDGKMTCPVTDCGASLKSNIKRHLREVHGGVPTDYEVIRAAHRHPKGKTVECLKCQKTISYANYASHIRDMHKDIEKGSDEYFLNRGNVSSNFQKTMNQVTERFVHDTLLQKESERSSETMRSEVKAMGQHIRVLIDYPGKKAVEVMESLKALDLGPSAKNKRIRSLNAFISYLVLEDKVGEYVFPKQQRDVLSHYLKAFAKIVKRDMNHACEVRMEKDRIYLNNNNWEIKKMYTSKEHQANLKDRVTLINYYSCLAAIMFELVVRSGTRPSYLRRISRWSLENPIHQATTKHGYSTHSIGYAKQRSKSGTICMSDRNRKRFVEVCKVSNPNGDPHKAFLCNFKGNKLSASDISKIANRYANKYGISDYTMTKTRKYATSMASSCDNTARSKVAKSGCHSTAQSLTHYDVYAESADTAKGGEIINQKITAAFRSENRLLQNDIEAEPALLSDSDGEHTRDTTTAESLTESEKEIEEPMTAESLTESEKEIEEPMTAESQPESEKEIEELTTAETTAQSQPASEPELYGHSTTDIPSQDDESDSPRKKITKQKRRSTSGRKITPRTKFAKYYYDKQRGPKSRSTKGCRSLTYEELHHVNHNPNIIRFYEDKASLREWEVKKTVDELSKQLELQRPVFTEKLKGMKKIYRSFPQLHSDDDLLMTSANEAIRESEIIPCSDVDWAKKSKNRSKKPRRN